MHYNICVTLHFNGSKESATTTQMLVMYVKAVTHQANSRLSAKVRPSLSVCQLSFWSVFHTIGTSWAPSVPFLPIEHVESTIGSQWDRSLWLAIQLCKVVHEKNSESDKSEQRVHTEKAFRHGMKKVKTNVIHVQNGKQALICLLFVYLQSKFRFLFLNDGNRLLPPAGITSYFLSLRRRTC